MFKYYVSMGWRGLRNTPVSSCLMILVMALGIAACTTSLTVLHVLAGDPMPGRSSILFRPQLEPRPMGAAPGEPPEEMSYADAMALLAGAPARRQVAMASTELAVHSAAASVRPFNIGVRTTTADFFGMFGTPFLDGAGWSRQDDAQHAKVIVLSAELARRLFPGGRATGQVVRLRDTDFRVIGVLEHWRPAPRFYDLGGGNYSHADDAYVPLATALDMAVQAGGAVTCWGSDFDPSHLDRAPCAWLQLWAELPTTADVTAYRDYLVRYSAQQHELGRFQQTPNVRLRGLLDWLAYKHVVPGDAALQAWLALGFLLICVANTSGLLLSKFLGRSGEMTVRRALGARRADIFRQILVEAGLVGLIGGVIGLLLSMAGLVFVRHQPVEYADLAQMDPLMLGAALIVTLGASAIAALLPALLSSRASMSLQLKTAG